jgi:hypothetical protein
VAAAVLCRHVDTSRGDEPSVQPSSSKHFPASEYAACNGENARKNKKKKTRVLISKALKQLMVKRTQIQKCSNILISNSDYVEKN